MISVLDGDKRTIRGLRGCCMRVIIAQGWFDWMEMLKTWVTGSLIVGNKDRLISSVESSDDSVVDHVDRGLDSLIT